MKRIAFTLSIVAVIISSVWAQAPQAFSYQTIVRNVSGDIVINQAVSFQISILEDNATGTVAYAETHTATTNELGLVNLQIGNGTPVSGTFASIDWPNHVHFLKVEFDITGGTTYTLMGTSQLLSVPYALHAKTVETDQDEQQLSISGDTIKISKGNFIIIPPNCDDGIQNRDETGVDCGGLYCFTCSAKCSNGIQDGDETGVDCGGTSCVSCAALCSDGIQNGDETGVDCGGTSCVSCVVRCSDGIQNADETGVDCGGTACVSCAARCSDGIQNGDETGVDCGGTSCVTCAELCSDGIQNGDETGLDCGGTSCIICLCYDGIQNGGETGVDCGGTSCVSCAVLCSDGIQNGDETGVDCGGTSCVSCAILCSDGVQNGDETGIDCGGTSCGPCVQQRLNSGETPKQIYDSGFPLDSLYGKTYQGGLIFYLNTATGTGLVAAPTDQAYLPGFSSFREWGCSGIHITGADGTAIGTGAQNTIDIETGCTTPGTAADICSNLILGAHTDWFLPSKDELNQMYVNLKINGFGGFNNSTYWSSTEFSNFLAWRQEFSSGFQGSLGKPNGGRVRSARTF